jgi:predicted transcriptional regulator of viral defense system
LSAAEYIVQKLSVEEYSFSWEELRQKSSKSDIALKRELSRLVSKKEIINVRKGFYLIIIPRYRNLGQLPVELFIEKLFRYLNKPYYLALYSAARHFGASHQQIQKDYIITQQPAMLDIEKSGVYIDFYTIANWPDKNVLQLKSDAGYFTISSPALTAADLIHNQTKLGGLNRMLAILEELSEEINENDVENLLSWYPYKTTLQRLGYVMEELQTNPTITEQLFEYLKKGNFFPVELSLLKEQKKQSVDNRWKVNVNLDLESDV